jgi:hypothetical protein
MAAPDFTISGELARRLSKMLEEYGRPFDTAHFCIHFTDDNKCSGCAVGDVKDILRLVVGSLEAAGLAIARPIDENLDS